MSKERDMRRTDWKRITKRRYVSRGGKLTFSAVPDEFPLLLSTR